MGMIEFVLFMVIVVGIAWVAVWVLQTAFPGHPVLIDRLVWVIAVLIIVSKFLQVTGLMAHDPPIPKNLRFVE